MGCKGEREEATPSLLFLACLPSAGRGPVEWLLCLPCPFSFFFFARLLPFPGETEGEKKGGGGPLFPFPFATHKEGTPTGLT